MIALLSVRPWCVETSAQGTHSKANLPGETMQKPDSLNNQTITCRIHTNKALF